MRGKQAVDSEEPSEPGSKLVTRGVERVDKGFSRTLNKGLLGVAQGVLTMAHRE